MPPMTEDTLTREQLLRARGEERPGLASKDAPPREPPAPGATPPAEETGSPRRPPCLQCGKPLPPRCTKFCSKLCGRRHHAARRGPEHPVPVATESPGPGPVKKIETGTGAPPAPHPMHGVVTLVAQLLDGTIVDSVEIHLDGARLVVRGR